MKINNLAQLEEAKKIVLEMRANTSNAFITGVFDEMLTELNKGDVENVYTPTYLSIVRFGYDIFNPLHRT
jgi:hypothetical protein